MGETRLLAGGNPQIPKGEGHGPVQAYIAAMPGWKREVGRRLDDLILPGTEGAAPRELGHVGDAGLPDRIGETGQLGVGRLPGRDEEDTGKPRPPEESLEEGRLPHLAPAADGEQATRRARSSSASRRESRSSRPTNRMAGREPPSLEQPDLVVPNLVVPRPGRATTRLSPWGASGGCGA